MNIEYDIKDSLLILTIIVFIETTATFCDSKRKKEKNQKNVQQKCKQQQRQQQQRQRTVNDENTRFHFEPYLPSNKRRLKESTQAYTFIISSTLILLTCTLRSLHYTLYND